MIIILIIYIARASPARKQKRVSKKASGSKHIKKSRKHAAPASDAGAAAHVAAPKRKAAHRKGSKKGGKKSKGSKKSHKKVAKK